LSSSPYSTSLPAASHVPFAVVTRGDAVDAVHFGSAAVVGREGALVAHAGDAHVVVTTRSSLKPFQAMPFVAAGGVERFGYTREEVALMCASHSGEPRHVVRVADMLAKAGLSKSDLKCGMHAPGFYDARGELPPPPPYSPLAHNCSGKHAAMLAHCVMSGWSTADYLDYDHPLQRAIRRAVSHFTGVSEDALIAGIDGCSAPNYAVPLSSLARAFARLADPAPDPAYGDAPARIYDAMTAHPEMVSGEGRNDLAFMRAGRGDWVAKIGAEALQAIGVRSRGLGLALKVVDGAKRGLHPATVSLLDQLGLTDAEQRAALEGWRTPTVKNYRAIVTGRVEPTVVLDKQAPRA